MKWNSYLIGNSTWEPSKHIPRDLRESFETPAPHNSLVEDCHLRIALLLERGLKVSLMTDVSLEMRHDVVQALFPSIPSQVSRSWHKLSKEEVIAAGFEGHLSQEIALTGMKREVIFPILVQICLGKSPAFYSKESASGKKETMAYRTC